MTAEIAIMNKQAIALAADSAIAAAASEGKIFNSAEKLFPLSTYHPVGIMIYQNAEFMGVPWETIIKIYRDRVLRKKDLKTLKAYATDFGTFLNKANEAFTDLFSESDQEEYFDSIIRPAFETIRNLVVEGAKKEIAKGRSIGDKEVRAMTRDTMQAVSDHYSGYLGNNKEYRSISHDYLRDVERRYERVIRKVEKRVLEALPIAKGLKETANNIAINCFAVHCLEPERFWHESGNYSGIVIAGFGKEDKFPSLESYKVGGIVGDRLIYLRDKYYREANRIGPKNRGRIFPFAQERTIQTFLSGIDPDCEEKAIRYFQEKATDLCRDIIDEVGNVDPEQKRVLDKQAAKKVAKAKEDYQRYIWDLGFHRSIPIEAGVVPVLPKDELALMAETLVSLASFERRVSPGRETVGGPIDVAVISKADGFVWVRKKRYFAQETNPDHVEADSGKS